MAQAVGSRSEVLKDATSLKLIGKPLLRTGFAYGLQFPSVTFAVRVVQRPEPLDLAHRYKHLVHECAADAIPSVEADAVAENLKSNASHADVLDWLGPVADSLGAIAGSPISQQARVLRAGTNTGLIVVPQLLRSLNSYTVLFPLLLGSLGGDQEAASDQSTSIEQFAAAFQKFRSSIPTQSNVPRFIKAAAESGIPIMELAGTSLIQFGIGRRSVIFDSTITEFTPNIGTRLARLKHEGGAILARHRIPVPRHALAADVEAAVRIANRIGYPVVVKPADRDGGIAVRADLRNEAELRAAYPIARKVSPRVLVEEFVTGRDYRLIVFRGRCVWALERQPAGVMGDGISTVAELIRVANEDPRRGNLSHSPLKILQLDDEASELLIREGLTPDSVPEAGAFVRLRRSSNVANGGMPVAMFHDLHPDNAVLAVRAAEALRLDLAGVDLLIPDISVSWKESGAHICEVNAQPQLGGVTANHLYGEVLKTLTQGGGRVPVIVCLGQSQAELLSEELANTLSLHGYIVGVHNRWGLRVSNTVIEQGSISETSAGRMLSMQKDVEVVIFGATSADVLKRGFPLPHIDLLILTGEQIQSPTTGASSDAAQIAKATLSVLLPSCTTFVATDEPGAFNPALEQALSSLKVTPKRLSRNRLHRALLEKLGDPFSSATPGLTSG